jgi:AMP-polyphosphate phosphotransferase
MARKLFGAQPAKSEIETGRSSDVRLCYLGGSMKPPSLKKLLDEKSFPSIDKKDEYEKRLKALQLEMLRIQLGLFHAKKRAIIAFEGFDASGKGGAIRRLTESLDPRSYRVIPIGPPSPQDQGRHYLYRFWRELPLPGSITLFDRTWYGRVLVERVDGLCSKSDWKRAYREINHFERMLVDDGIDLVKIFLAVSKDEQLARFEERLNNPYKQWKIGEPDIRARSEWSKYVEAADQMFEETHTKHAPWHLVPGDYKWFARLTTLEIVTERLREHGKWMEARAEKRERSELKRELAKFK